MSRNYGYINSIKNSLIEKVTKYFSQNGCLYLFQWFLLESLLNQTKLAAIPQDLSRGGYGGYIFFDKTVLKLVNSIDKEFPFYRNHNVDNPFSLTLMGLCDCKNRSGNTLSYYLHNDQFMIRDHYDQEDLNLDTELFKDRGVKVILDLENTAIIKIQVIKRVPLRGKTLNLNKERGPPDFEK